MSGGLRSLSLRNGPGWRSAARLWMASTVVVVAGAVAWALAVVGCGAVLQWCVAVG